MTMNIDGGLRISGEDKAKDPDVITSSFPGHAENPNERKRRAQRIVRMDDLVVLDSDDAQTSLEFKRRFKTLFVDEDRLRRGGIGDIVHATNAWGEQFAIKVLNLNDGLSEEARVSNQKMFESEYEALSKLSGLSGFPRVYGNGYINGSFAIIMEWVEGSTLEHVRPSLAIDDRGRLNPLDVARIGRDIASAMASANENISDFTHGDISTSNVMFKVNVEPLSDQINEGAYDVCVIDLGSSMLEGSQGDQAAAEDVDAFRSTPAFAAPEMMYTDGSKDSPQPSTKSDVYALGTLMYLLLCGKLPYRFDHNADLNELRESLSRQKLRTPPDPVVTVHGSYSDIASVLAKEPEIAVAVGRGMANLDSKLNQEDVRTALLIVDQQLVKLIFSCLSPDPADRPTFAYLAEALNGFCNNYEDNVGYAMCGEELEPCIQKTSTRKLSSNVRTAVRVTGKSIAFAILAIVIISSGFLLDGVNATFILGAARWRGMFPGIIASVAFVIPTLLGFLLRWRKVSTFNAFLRGTLGLLVGWILVLVACIPLQIRLESAQNLIFAAFLACFATSWCVMVLDYAFPKDRRRKNKSLPPGTPTIEWLNLPQGTYDKSALLFEDTTNLNSLEEGKSDGTC